MRRKRAVLMTLILMTVIAATPIFLTWRQVRQEQLNQFLIAAVDHNDAAAVRDLLRHGAEPNAPISADDNRPLWMRVWDVMRHKSTLHAVVQDSALCRAARWTPHSSSGMDDNFAIIKALINAGANVHVKDDHNRSGNPMTPVLSAAILHKWKALTLLVAHHAEVKGEDDDGNTALILAAESADEEVVRLLLQQGVRVNAMNKRDLTAVGYAVAHNRIGVVRLLIDWGADVKYDGSGLLASAPIEVAAREGNDDMVRLLLAHGAKVDQRYEGSEDGVGVSALAVASMHHHRSTVDLLLAHGADINACARFGTALTFAAEGGDLSLVRFLVARGANVNARDAYRTVLEAAVEHPDVVRYLLRHGAEVDKPGRPGNWDITPLNRAAIVGAVGSIRVLLEYGADINRPAGDGDTPLMTAARAGHQEVVKTLIQSGADINLQTHHREAGGDELSALDIAEQEKKDAVVRLLRQAGAQE